MLTRQQQLDPPLIDGGFELAQFNHQFLLQGGVRRFVRQLDQGAQVPLLPFEVRNALNIPLDGGLFSAYSGSGLGVVPKIGMRRFLFEMLQVGV
jgi:hypothetical protein